MSHNPSSPTAFRTDIQGLRAIAVLAVMLFHYNPAWLPGGFVGVDVFLVISGYLIVRILLQKKAQPGYRLAATLRYFYIGRIKRIAPAYFAMLVLVSLLTAVLLLPQDLGVYKKGLNQAAWFHSNSYFAGFGDYFAPASHEQPLLHTWSLAVEIQFYLLAPLLVLLLPTKSLKWVLGVLLVGLTLLAQYRLSVQGIQQATYYSLYARLPEFFAGGLVAVYMHSFRGGAALLAGRRGPGVGAGRRCGAAPVRPVPWPAGAAARGGRRAHPLAPCAGACPAPAGQPPHGLGGRTVVLAVSVALARAGLAALLRRRAGAGHAL